MPLIPVRAEFELSYGATWLLYNNVELTSTTSKTIYLAQGEMKTQYIKVISYDKEHTNVYTVNFYRNTKSISPVITASRDKVTITAENCEIYYTVDGTVPTESKKYTGVFSALSNTTIKAIAVEPGKDEQSSVVTFEVPEYLAMPVTEICDNGDGTCNYAIKLQLEKTVTDYVEIIGTPHI